MADHDVAQAMRKCETCRWARPYPAPGPVPAPEECRLLWGLFTVTLGPSEVDMIIHDMNDRRHREDVQCARNPKALRKSKDDWCGEYAPHTPTPHKGARDAE